MHSPPSVCYPVGRSRTADRLMGLGWLSGAACAAGAAFAPGLSGVADWRAWAPCALAALAGLASWHFRWRSSKGQLVLDGGQWSWQSEAGTASQIECPRTCLDLQGTMLLHLCTPGRSDRWLWVDRDAMPSCWSDLRRALCAGREAQAEAFTTSGDRVTG